MASASKTKATEASRRTRRKARKLTTPQLKHFQFTAKKNPKAIVTTERTLSIDTSKIRKSFAAGVTKLVEEDEKMPAKYSGTDGVIYDPKWQDDSAGD